MKRIQNKVGMTKNAQHMLLCLIKKYYFKSTFSTNSKYVENIGGNCKTFFNIFEKLDLKIKAARDLNL